MVERRITDGRRIAQLLASELSGREDGEFAHLSVADADRDVEPTPDGARAYDVHHGDDRLARVFVHDERARLEFDALAELARSAATDGELRVELDERTASKAFVFVEDGAQVKRAADVVEAVSRSVSADGVSDADGG